jgi:hypothetical protein
VLALTATATEGVTRDILLDLNATDARVINAGSERTNFFFAMHPTVNNDAKLARLTQMVADDPGSGIVYTASVRSANDLHERFTEAGIAVAHCHGRLAAKRRQHALADFINNKYGVMIATKAFGLGIDKQGNSVCISLRVPLIRSRVFVRRQAAQAETVCPRRQSCCIGLKIGASRASFSRAAIRVQTSCARCWIRCHRLTR